MLIYLYLQVFYFGIKKGFFLERKLETFICLYSKNSAIYIYIYIRMGCKIYVLYNLISDCHVSILFKIQYILTHLITFQ